ncbi:hypothetical protein HYH02_003035 [Chlamydomonas schloesseri]|uniref:legumain n=1 Tax=Chlamydomonas schloesseri TaxID=2026947 RepID=A0A835WU69_9CHLO|nr:hypothetical protein HYH02_003035 [Chlamydomonas schloesseri]|eukprot:KAG2452806.1 hypothetical protein HYH02_003035 [Chlamydomonas schloesseri]
MSSPGQKCAAQGIQLALFVICCCLTLSRGGWALRLPSLSFQHHVRRSEPERSQGLQVSARAASLTPAAKKPTDFADGDDATIRNHWALLVAGSAGWGNYRHQADVCHAYQVLLRGGLRPAHMVTMMYDDIAHDPENPFPGQVFNSPGGPDVYGGVRVDYRGADVSAAVFLAVLGGNASALPPGTRGSGRVLASGPFDRVFVFYSDHGAPGVLGMPSGSFLYADELVGALQRKWQHRGYKEAVLYIEACESGSMFEGLLPPDIGAYATTASNAMESSWGTYCPGMSPGPPPLFSTCLGDLYSVAWMENADVCDLTQETLMAQYSIVRNRTSNNYTYSMGSHVMQYGSLAISREVAGDYQGMRNRGGGEQQQQQQQHGAAATGFSDPWSEAAAAQCRPTPSPAPAPCPSPSAAPPAPKLVPRPSSASPGGGERAQGQGSGSGGRTGWLGAAGALLQSALHWARSVFGGAIATPLTRSGTSRSSSRGSHSSSSGSQRTHRRQAGPHAHVPQREADLAPLRHAAAHAASPERRAAAAEALGREEARRQGVDQSAVAAATSLLRRLPSLVQEVAPLVAAPGAADDATRRRLAGPGAGSGSGAGSEADPVLLAAMAQDLVYGPVRRGRRHRRPEALASSGAMTGDLSTGQAVAGGTAAGQQPLGAESGGRQEGEGEGAQGEEEEARPLVDDWDCLRAMVAAWSDSCGPMAADQYAMRHTRLLARLCNAHVPPALVAEALRGSGCGAAGAV